MIWRLAILLGLAAGGLYLLYRLGRFARALDRKREWTVGKPK